MASIIYTSILIPNLLLGVPRNWFVFSGLGFMVPYFFMDQKIAGLMIFLFLHFVGFALTKWYDPDFVNILTEKLRYFDGISFGKPKIYHD